MIIAIFLDYNAFRQAVTATSQGRILTMVASTLSGPPAVFTAIAYFDTNLALRVYLDAEPAQFNNHYRQVLRPDTVVVE